MNRSRLGWILVLASLPTVVAAQERPAPPRPDSGNVTPLDSLVVTAGAVPLRPEQVGFAFTVVPTARLRLQRPRLADQALRDVEGSFVEEAAGPGGPTIVRLRGGEEVFTQILIDGVQVNQNGGFFDFQGLQLTNLDRVEVARGPQSALFGSSAISGVVQYLTPPGRPGPARFDALLEAGQATVNGGSARGSITVSGGTPRLRYSAGGGAGYDRGIYDEPNDTRSGDAALRLDWLPADRWYVTTNVRLLHVDGNLPVRDPGATRVPLDPNARNARDRVVASAVATLDAGPRLTQRFKGTLYLEDFTYEDTQDGVPQPESFFVPDFTFDFGSTLARPHLEYGGTWAPVRSPNQDLRLSYGVLWEQESLTETLGGDFGPSEEDFARSNTAGYAEAVYDVASRLSLLGGARIEKFQGLDAEVTPRVSANLAVRPGVLALRGAWGRGYKAPDLRQQFQDNPFIESNPDLEPETSTSWEVGADAEAMDGALRAGLTYFDQRFRNLIRTVAQEDSDKQINRNLGAARARGVEGTLRYRLDRRWALGGGVTWIGTEVLDATGLNPAEFPEGESLPFRPDVTANAHVEARNLGPVDALLRALYVGEMTVLTERFSGRRETIDPYVLLGATVQVHATRGVTVYTRLDNLLGTAYETGFDRRGIPFTAVVGVELGG